MRRRNGKKLTNDSKRFISLNLCLFVCRFFFNLQKGLRRLIYRVTENKYNVSFLLLNNNYTKYLQYNTISRFIGKVFWLKINIF